MLNNLIPKLCPEDSANQIEQLTKVMSELCYSQQLLNEHQLKAVEASRSHSRSRSKSTSQNEKQLPLPPKKKEEVKTYTTEYKKRSAITAKHHRQIEFIEQIYKKVVIDGKKGSKALRQE